MQPCSQLVLERFERFLERNSVALIRALSSLLLCVVLLLLCSCVCLYSLLTLMLDCDQLCKAWETPICGDSSQPGTWYKEDIHGTQVWSLDHLRGVECNPWPKEVTTMWSRHWPNHGKKSPCLIVHLLYCDCCLLEFSYSLGILLLSLIHISKEQSSEEFSFPLLSHPNLALFLSNSF